MTPEAVAVVKIILVGIVPATIFSAAIIKIVAGVVRFLYSKLI